MARKQHDQYYTNEQKVVAAVFAEVAPMLARLKRRHELRDVRVLFIEPCTGDGAIAKALQIIVNAFDMKRRVEILEMDITPRDGTVEKADLWNFNLESLLRKTGYKPDGAPMGRTLVWIVTNPPYKMEQRLDLGYKGRKDSYLDSNGDKQYRDVINVMACIEHLHLQFDKMPTFKEGDEFYGLSIYHSWLLRVTQLEPVETNKYMIPLIESLTVLARMSFTGDGHTDSATAAWFRWVATTETWSRAEFARCPRTIDFSTKTKDYFKSFDLKKAIEQLEGDFR